MRGAVISLLLGLVAFAQGEISESREFIVKTPQHRIVTRLAENLGWPERPIDRGLVVIVDAGGGAASILAMGPIASDAKPMARALERFAGKDAVWSQEDDASAAKVEFGSAKFGKVEGTNVIDIPRLRKELEAVATPVRIALRTPVHAKADPVSPEVGEGRSWRLTVAPETRVTVRAVAPAWTIPAIAFFILAIPVFGSLFFWLAMRTAKDERIPVDERRKKYRFWVQSGTVGLLAVHAVIAIAVIGGGALRVVGDLWFGSPSVGWAIPFIAGMVLPMLLIAPTLTAREIKLFGPQEGQTPRGEREGLPPKPTVDPALKAAFVKETSRSIRSGIGPLFPIIIALPLASLLFPRNEWMPMVVLIALTALAIYIAVRAYHPRFKPKPVGAEFLLADPFLQAEADELADALGVKRVPIVVNRNPALADVARSEVLSTGAASINARAIDILDSRERRFVIGSLLFPHSAKRFMQLMMLVNFGLFAIVIGSRWVLPAHLRSYSFGLVFLLPLAMVPLLRLSRRWEIDRDRRVLAVTGDRDAAEQALRKLHADSSEEPLPKETEARIAAWG